MPEEHLYKLNATVSELSLFELQAKAAKLGIDPKHVTEAVDAIISSFKVLPFYAPEVTRIANDLLKRLNDYVDCIIVATAVAMNETLVTEDTKILENKKFIEDKYKIKVKNYKSMAIQDFIDEISP
ncbi:MAG: PIN domain-containing protein [Candidatus Micrarchaeota archaeon]|nr:PIN domain-containing protein [Candidatus Micrarchaeota archaeon]